MPTDQRTTGRTRQRANAKALPQDPWLAPGANDGLPLGLPELIGRARELAEVTELFETSRVVTLTGPAGIGKTRLALEVAHRLRDRYPAGAWLVDLAPVVDPDLVPAAAAAAIGLDPEPGRDPLDALCAHLRRRKGLVVLDNCEHVLDAGAALVQRLWDDCPRVAVLVTSQEALGLEPELTSAVTALSLPAPRPNPTIASALESDAIRLFCTRAVASHAGFRLTDEVVPSVAEICHRLDGIPLAIELAAARVAVLGPMEIAERIETRFELLTKGDSTAPARHQTLRAALDWSYELLTDEEALLLRRLSVFAGSAGLEAVEEICSGRGVRRDDVIDLLSSLVAKSLVLADTSRCRARYHLLETIRAYGRGRLQESGEGEDVHARLTAWCISMVERSWQHASAGDPRSWLTMVETDHDNVRAAMEWAMRNEPRFGLRLAAGMTPFWRARGYFREGRRWLERMLGSQNADAPAALRARALWGFGMFSTLQGDVGPARVAVEESLALAREARLGRAEVQALNLLGFISIFSQNAVAAKPLLEKSVAMARASGDMDSVAATLALAGRVHLFLGEVDQARTVFEECLALSDDYPAGALIGLGWVALAAGEDGKSRQLFEQTLPLLREADERFDIALVLSFLGDLAWARGDFAEARTMLEEGRELALAMGAPYPLVRCLYRLASVAAAEGNLASALKLVDEACDVAERAHLPYAMVRALHVRGDLDRAAGDTSGAGETYTEALSVARSNSDRDGEAGSLHRLAELARKRGADHDAVSLLHEALTVQANVGDARIASFLETMAGMGGGQGRPAHAARLFGAADALRQEVGNLRRPDEIAGYQTDVDGLRSAMGKTEFAEAWAEGAALSRDEVVSMAMRGRGSRDPDRPTCGWASLTRTEVRIVDLVAEALTNKEIGEQLFVSDRTVQGHLARIFRKLDISSRRELREAHRQRKG